MLFLYFPTKEITYSDIFFFIITYFKNIISKLLNSYFSKILNAFADDPFS